jgi:hypothetical protein
MMNMSPIWENEKVQVSKMFVALSAYLMMVNADVQAVDNRHTRFVDLRNNRVIRFRRRMNDPDPIVVGIEINHAVVRRVEMLIFVDVLHLNESCGDKKVFWEVGTRLKLYQCFSHDPDRT